MEFSGVAACAAPDRLEVFGDQGMLSYNFSNDEIHGGRLGQRTPTQLSIPPELELRWNVERDFIAAVRSPASIVPQPSFGEGLEYMKVVQAVADSIAQKCEVEID